MTMFNQYIAVCPEWIRIFTERRGLEGWGWGAVLTIKSNAVLAFESSRPRVGMMRGFD